MTKYKGMDYTKVVFHPDLKKFGMESLDADIVKIMQKRVYDIAGSSPKACKVYLNDNLLPVNEFKDYVNLYFESTEQPRVYERCGKRWEYVIAISDGQFQQVSFVNCTNTTKGGTHVLHVADQFVDAIHKRAKAKNKGGMQLKPYHVRSHLWVFVNCLIVNPTFDSQTKENMTLKSAKFGSQCEVTNNAINHVLKTGIVDTILQWAKAKESIDMKRKMKATGRTTRILGIPKLEDANCAGGRGSEECTLILTEGDSAKTLAVAGLSIIGRDHYGVFPLRGKPLNVREASFQQTMNNQEIQNVIKIMGLDQQREYDSVKGLRYGSIMIMADQDFDGSHIKGLIINMVQCWWPSLFKMDGFLKEFCTPIIKVMKASQEVQFFCMPDYEAWKAEHQDGKGWTTKYYKGLGTSTSKEGKEYFKNIERHRTSFVYTGEKDGEAIDLAFNKKRADDRKDWINAHDEAATLDHTSPVVNYGDFVNKELVVFAKYDVMRAIPSVVDGFKPTQRKVLFAAFKRNLNSEVKVAQLAGYISEHSAYHHGETSLQGTIVWMAQTFVGSNNINLLTPCGQFGTRLQGGKDAASARYIFTRLERIARVIFHPDDDPLLEFQNEEGQSIEPRWYIPVIPMVLVNGAEGIGTGWSTSLPNYNPRDLIRLVKEWIKTRLIGDALVSWYKGFKGSVVVSDIAERAGYEFVGVAARTGPTTVDITELPVKRWTQDYKEFLAKLLEGESEGKARIDSFKEFHTDNAVHFTLSGSEEQINALEQEGLDKALKLRSSASTANFVFFDAEGRIKKYANEKDILTDFVELRLEYYQKRKDYHRDRLGREREFLDSKVRFLLLVVNGELVVSGRKRADLVSDLRRRGFKTRQEILSKQEVAPGGSEERQTGFDYLLGMAIWSITKERLAELRRQLQEKLEELETLERMSTEDLWQKDLDAVLVELDRIDEEDEAVRAEDERIRAGKRSRPKSKPKGKAKTQAKSSAVAVDEVSDEASDEPPLPKKTKTETALRELSNADLLARLKERQQSRSNMSLDDTIEDGAADQRAKSG
eukprot:NODE_58_length_3974_cov_5.738757.p1 GENE.NODE_58_length_3974_cov_5.738757~~NODE_58_length_3974_cov_5.738757.p1  ORF type:complete len:1228 (-),score=322.94 NODE_58_length_3974_cov_5.738757:289-3429(-)